MKNTDRKTIYLPLQGRIGNQLFQYAFARRLQLDFGEGTELVVDDSDVLRCKWVNSLKYYDLPNVSYVHTNIRKNRLFLSWIYIIRMTYRLLTKWKDYNSKYEFEKKHQGFFNRNGVFICENGYINPKMENKKTVYIEGYFQSEKYFASVKDDIIRLFDGNQFKELNEYPCLDQLRSRNSVCISVKVEHNVGNPMYDVCTMDYWKSAIDFICENVEAPYFFICSDNVDYVLEHLIDASKYDYTVQDKNMPVHVSLSAMAQCKHFIIGNTSYGWWAQYLSKNKDKIVVAPSRWMGVDMPIDIYQDGWHLIQV